MKKIYFFQTLVFLTIIGFANLNGAIPLSERNALISIFNNTDSSSFGKPWNNVSNWFDVSGTEGTWYGVTVENDHVVALDLSSNNLRGIIPSEIKDLPELRYLNLSNNHIRGNIPSELGELVNLRYLYLDNNLFIGNLPSSFADLTNLKILMLNDNKLEGNFFSHISDMDSLEFIIISNNQFSGSIISNIDDFHFLSKFIIDRNQFTGNIPSSICNLDSLTDLVLAFNQFEGSIPSSIGNLVKLTQLDLSSNLLTGSVPSSISTLINLENFRLSDNQLEGNIPSQIGNLSKLKFLFLTNNLLSGSIPTQMGNLSNLLVLQLDGNDLSGNIPTQIGNLSNLEYLYLNDNDLTGSIPTQIGNLSKLQCLFLNDNQLNGNIPSQLGSLVKLKILSLSRNDFNGSIPSNLSNLKEMTELVLDSNRLSGDFPVASSNMDSLKKVVLSNNLFTSVPAYIQDLPNLEYLNLDNNIIAGTLPASLKNLNRLQELYLRNNKITQVPNYSDGFDSLKIFFIQNNNLDFSDIIPNINVASSQFVYSPQVMDGNDSLFQSRVNGNFVITIPNHVANNKYAWKKNGLDIGELTTATFTKSNLAFADSGVYYCTITNSNAPDLQIISLKYEASIYGPPSVTTIPATLISQTAARLNGVVVNEHLREVTQRGVSWSLDPNPDMTDNIIIAPGTGVGDIIANLGGLTENTTYYFRAFATNSEGTSLGNEVSFKTLSLGNESKEYLMTFSLDTQNVVMDSNPVLTRREIVIPFGEQGDVTRTLGKEIIKAAFSAMGFTLPGIVIDALDFFGSAGLKINLGFSGKVGGYFQVLETNGTDIKIEYPYNLYVEFPESNSFACGEEITIKTTASLPKQNDKAFEARPPFYTTEIGAILKDLSFTAGLSFSLPKGPCGPVPYPCPTWKEPWKWCTEEVCFPPAVSFGESINIPMPDGFPQGDIPLISICEEGFSGDTDALLSCANNNALLNSVPMFVDIVNNDKLCFEPPLVNGNPRFCFSKASPSELKFSSTEGKAILSRSGTKQDVVNLSFDIIDLLINHYKKANKEKLGKWTKAFYAKFLVDPGDFRPIFAVNQENLYEMTPKISMQVDLGTSMTYSVINPVNNNIISSGTGRYVSLTPGNHIKITIPDFIEDKVEIKPVFSMTSDIATKVWHRYFVKLSYSILDVTLPGIVKWSLIPEKVIFEKEIGSSQIENRTKTLSGFVFQGANEPVMLDPIKPRIDITYLNVDDIINIGNGYRKVIYKVKLKNNGDVPIYYTKLNLDLAETFASAKSFKVNSITSNSGVSLNAGYNGATDVNLFGSNFIIANGEEIPVVIEAEVKPEIAQIGSDDCFIPVMYFANAYAEGYTPPTRAQANGYLITDSRELCTRELFADVNEEEYPMISDVDLGAQIIKSIDDYAIYGFDNVYLDRSFELSYGNIGSSGFIRVGPISSEGKFSKDARIIGDIHAGRYLYLFTSPLTTDYLQLAVNAGRFGATAVLSYTGAMKQRSKCVSVFDRPSLALPDNNSQNIIVIRSTKPDTLEANDYKSISMYDNSVLNLSTGTYNIGELRLLGRNLQINCDAAEGPVILNIKKFSMQTYSNVNLMESNNLSTRSIQINYSDSRALKFYKSTIQGTILAPFADVSFNHNSSLEGACYAKSVTIGVESRYKHHRYFELPNSYLKYMIPDDFEFALDKNSINVFPNPFSNYSNIIFNLIEDDYIEIEVYNMTGRLIATLAKGEFAKGQHFIEFAPSDGLDDGVLFCILKTSSTISSTKILRLNK